MGADTDTPNSTGLASSLSNPSTIDQQTKGRAHFLSEHTSTRASEGNMLSLLTMKDLLRAGSADEKALQAIAMEESKYLRQAMKIVSADINQITDADHKRTITRLQDTYGKDLAAAYSLANLLKTEQIRDEFQASIKPLLGFTKSQAGAFGQSKILAGTTDI